MYLRRVLQNSVFLGNPFQFPQFPYVIASVNPVKHEAVMWTNQRAPFRALANQRTIRRMTSTRATFHHQNII